MSDRAALYAAICADPEDDTARLVFADWLEEHGDAKRAAFIRAEVEVHRLRNADTDAAWARQFFEGEVLSGIEDLDWSAVDPELAALYAAEHAASDSLHKVRITPRGEGLTARLKGVRVQGTDRGFLCRVNADDGAAFLRHAAAVFRAAPVTDVSIDTLTEEDARDLVQAGHLARIRSLTLWDIEDPEALAVLGNHPDAAGVRELELEATDDGAGVADALRRGKHWTGLRRLDMMELGEADEPMDDDQAAALFRRPKFSGLRELNAWGNDLEDTSVRAIAAGGMPELRFLDLSINEITGDGADAIARSKGLPNLRSLDLASNNIFDIDADAAARLIVSPKLPRLSGLKLDGAKVGAADPKIFARNTRGPTLRALQLENCGLTAEVAAALATSPALRGLWYLALNQSNLRPPALDAFLKAAAFDRLTALNLDGNRLTAKSAKAIAGWPAAANLQWLGLSQNPLTPAGLDHLADSPHLGALKHLTASGSAVSKAFKKLKKRFGKALARG